MHLRGIIGWREVYQKETNGFLFFFKLKMFYDYQIYSSFCTIFVDDKRWLTWLFSIDFHSGKYIGFLKEFNSFWKSIRYLNVWHTATHKTDRVLWKSREKFVVLKCGLGGSLAQVYSLSTESIASFCAR
jgi:hypothetical protein